jgi:hypothetical protein
VKRSSYDVVIVAGSSQFESLRRLLPRLEQAGTVHLVSSYLTDAQIAALDGLYDVLHEPRLHPEGYENFKLFCIRKLNRVVTAPRFIKLDTDVGLADDWLDYVEETLALHPDAVLFGPHSGSNLIDYRISGPLVRHKIGRDVRVHFGTKVNGSFYVARTDFFREHDLLMQKLHDLTYAFVDGERIRRSHLGDDEIERELSGARLLRPGGQLVERQGTCSEDNLRSLTVHVAGASRRLVVRDAGARLWLPDKARPPSWAKRSTKWARSLASRLTP